MINYKDLKENKQELTEKFDPKKAEKALKDILTAYNQVKFVGANRDVIRRWDDMWYTTYTAWFSSNNMKDMGLPIKLK